MKRFSLLTIYLLIIVFNLASQEIGKEKMDGYSLDPTDKKEFPLIKIENNANPLIFNQISSLKPISFRNSSNESLSPLSDSDMIDNLNVCIDGTKIGNVKESVFSDLPSESFTLTIEGFGLFWESHITLGSKDIKAIGRLLARYC